MERNFRVLASLGTLFKNKTKQYQQQQKAPRIFFFIQGMDFPEGKIFIQTIHNQNKMEKEPPCGGKGLCLMVLGAWIEWKC